MSHHLHPRSGWTMSLFTTTLFASFLVVAMPHILPCPAAQRIYADGEMPAKKRRKGRATARTEAGDGASSSGTECRDDLGASEDVAAPRHTRECPVPKPGGRLGELLRLAGRDGATPERQRSYHVTQTERKSRDRNS